MVPLEIFSRPEMHRRVVLLPQPLGPSSVKNCPAPTEKFTPSTTLIRLPLDSNDLRRFFTLSIPTILVWHLSMALVPLPLSIDRPLRIAHDTPHPDCDRDEDDHEQHPVGRRFRQISTLPNPPDLRGDDLVSLGRQHQRHGE